MGSDWHLLPLLPLKPLLDLLGNGNARHFCAYILTGMIIAIVAHWHSGSRESFASVFLARQAWLSRSALNDYGLLILNPVILYVCSAWLLAFANEWSAGLAQMARLAGIVGEVSGPAAIAWSAALTFSLFVADDFMRWLSHYAMHRIPTLWEFHKVHHSAETLNFATAERFHPVDILFTGGTALATAALVNWMFIIAAGDQLTVETFAGANVLWVAFNLAGGVLRHSPAWVSFGARLERWFVSPAMHQIHHSAESRHFDRNFGGSLAVWDRWFGTIYIPDGREKFAYGIGSENPQYRTLSALYLLPFRKAWQRHRERVRRLIRLRPAIIRAFPTVRRLGKGGFSKGQRI